jgi:hypothetical protein
MLKNTHRALLGLVAWYLLIPPTSYYWPEWRVAAGFSSYQDCRTYLDNVRGQVANCSPLSASDQLAHLYSAAECVETHEPLAT